MRGVAITAGLILLLWLAACDGRGAPDLPGRIILLSMDTVRLDAVGAPPSENLPHLRQIAAEGATFANFYAASTYTIPSHMSIFTGLDPESHGVESEFTVLAEGIVPLAERLRALLEDHRRNLERHGAGRREQPFVPSGAHRERLRDLG